MVEAHDLVFHEVGYHKHLVVLLHLLDVILCEPVYPSLFASLHICGGDEI